MVRPVRFPVPFPFEAMGRNRVRIKEAGLNSRIIICHDVVLAVALDPAFCQQSAQRFEHPLFPDLQGRTD